MKKIIIIFLFLNNISYSQELGILLMSVSEAEAELDRISLEYKYINDTTIVTSISNTDGFYLKFTNDYCYHEEFRTTNLNYNVDSIRTLLSKECILYEDNIYYYEVGTYRFYYMISETDDFIRIIKTIREMPLSD